MQSVYPCKAQQTNTISSKQVIDKRSETGIWFCPLGFLDSIKRTTLEQTYIIMAFGVKAKTQYHIATQTYGFGQTMPSFGLMLTMLIF